MTAFARRLGVLVVVGLTLSSARSARAGAPAWYRVDAPHFVVSGNASADEVREVAFLLEMFRDVFARVLPAARERALQPPFVVVFRSDHDFSPYKPTYDGKQAPVAGYVIREPLAPCLAMRLDSTREAYRTIFHEYAHVLFDVPRAPLWLSEGIADYYSTATVNRDRRRVLIGGQVRGHLFALSRNWLPLRQLLTTPRTGKIWGTDDARAFYAESWALVHYLMLDTPQRGSQVLDFIGRLAAGEDEAAAFEAAIGPVARVESALRAYVRRGLAEPKETALPVQVGVRPLDSHRMRDAEVEATLGRLLHYLERPGEAVTRLEAALALEPGLAEAHAALGMVRLHEGRAADAVGPFGRALARDPANLLVAYDYALASLQAHDMRSPAPIEEAFAALDRVAPREGPAAEPVALLGTIAGRLGRLDEAEALLRRAATLEPDRLRTRLELADVCLRLGRFDEARALLARARAETDDEQAASVDQRWGWLAMAESRAALRGELAVAAGLQEPGRDPAIARTGRFPPAPGWRAPLPGEQRVAGLLTSIDCTPRHAIARLVTSRGALDLAAPDLAGIYAASGRSDVVGTVTCGARPRREAVYVTWKDDHRLVAIEFLPEDLQPGGAGREPAPLF